jgi:hypothetical protein
MVKNEDDYFDGVLMAHLEEQDTYDDLFTEEKDLLIAKLSIGDSHDELDFTDSLYDVRKSLLEALAKDNKDEVVWIVYKVFNEEVDKAVKRTLDEM